MANTYSFEAILSSMLSQVSDNVDKREGSIIYDALAPIAVALSAQNYMLASFSDLLFADTASGEWLDRVVNDFGLVREGATNSIRRISCVDSLGKPMPIPIGTRFALGNLVFAVTLESEIGLYEAACEALGTQGNCGEGAVLPIDNISGLGVAVLAAQPLVSARDDETDEQLRKRFYDAIRCSPFGGNKADYREKALSVDGVGCCAVFGACDGMGAGNVGLVIANEEGTVASANLLEAVDAFFSGDKGGNGMAPIGHAVSVSTCEMLPINISAVLVLKSGASINVVEAFAKAAVTDYINAIAFEGATVFYARVVSALLTCHEAVLDVQSVSLNGVSSNIALKKDFGCWQIPKIGNVAMEAAI